MRLNPLGDRVVVEINDTQRTGAGLYVPQNVTPDSAVATVLAVGPGRTESGVQIEPRVKRGDVILAPRRMLREFNDGARKLHVINEYHIDGILESDKDYEDD